MIWTVFSGERCGSWASCYKSVVSLRWTLIPPSDDEGNIPYQRYGHTCVGYHNSAYIWGGRNDKDGACNILYAFDSGKIFFKIQIGNINRSMISYMTSRKEMSLKSLYLSKSNWANFFQTLQNRAFVESRQRTHPFQGGIILWLRWEHNERHFQN